MIQTFRGDYSFLSNFYECNIKFNGLSYSNAEAVYQSMKVPENIRDKFTFLNGGEAKHFSKNYKPRKDWNKVKDDIMYHVVLAKFSQNPDLKKKLIHTGGEELVEGNTWGDSYWGYDTIKEQGLNKLGKILMRVREELK